MNTIDWHRDFGLGGHVLDDGRFEITAVVSPAPASDTERKIEEYFLQRLNVLGTWVLFSFALWGGIFYLGYEIWNGLF
jgi:hypothetical protein